jgi:hypothetical protein
MKYYHSINNEIRFWTKNSSATSLSVGWLTETRGASESSHIQLVADRNSCKLCEVFPKQCCNVISWAFTYMCFLEIQLQKNTWPYSVSIVRNTEADICFGSISAANCDYLLCYDETCPYNIELLLNFTKQFRNSTGKQPSDCGIWSVTHRVYRLIPTFRRKMMPPSSEPKCLRWGCCQIM